MIAMLIDADNVSYRNIKDMTDELARFGNLTIKRIYGDFTKSSMNGWKDVLLENAINPIQQYNYTTGKNATNSSMIIDAMDILYSNQVDIFCLVSSDSDFTRLAMRLREAGKEVIGMGMKKTPQPFIAACNKFVYIEVLSHSLESRQVKEVSPESASIVEKESVSPLKEGIQILQASDNQLTFEEYLKGLYHQGVIDMDDFTICWLYEWKKYGK